MPRFFITCFRMFFQLDLGQWNRWGENDCKRLVFNILQSQPHFLLTRPNCQSVKKPDVFSSVGAAYKSNRPAGVASTRLCLAKATANYRGRADGAAVNWNARQKWANFPNSCNNRTCRCIKRITRLGMKNLLTRVCRFFRANQRRPGRRTKV